jgi:dienelactone hydrolase
MQNRNYATLSALWADYAAMPRQLAWRAQNLAEWATWRAALQTRLIARLGGFPNERPPLDPVVLETTDLADYRQEKVVFQSEPGLYTPCYVLTPHTAKPPYRPVIALHGHGSGGAAHVIGLTRGATTRQAEEEHIARHNYDYGRQLAQRGFMVFALEQRGFGERMEPHPGMITGGELWQSSCRALAFTALLLGKTLLGLRVWDVMRTIDYIHSRPEPLIKGVGCLGLSGGGTTTLFATAVEPRITVSILSGAFGSFRSSIMSTIHCECNYLPGILQDAEMADIAALIAPRPLLIENGTEDPIFPVTETKAACQEVAKAYALLGVAERLEQDIFVGGHQFRGNKAFDWLDRWLVDG